MLPARIGFSICRRYVPAGSVQSTERLVTVQIKRGNRDADRPCMGTPEPHDVVAPPAAQSERPGRPPSRVVAGARWVLVLLYLVGSGASYRPRDERGPLFGKLAAAVITGTIVLAVFAVIGFAIAWMYHKLAGTPRGRVGKSLLSALTSVPIILVASVQTVSVYFFDHPHG